MNRHSPAGHEAPISHDGIDPITLGVAPDASSTDRSAP